MKILIIEDEHRIASSIKMGLTQERYAVDVSYDGTTGYDLATSEEYDVIILDRLLPGMDGVELLKKLREKDIHTPVLLLTAKGQLSEKVEGLEAGADDYLVKPFFFEELLARIHALVRRPKQTIEEKLRVNDLSLNTRTYEVVRGGKKIFLSQKEFSLLEYLMRHPKQILSKDQIISHVWSYESDILPNTVEVYIGYLRTKIDKPFPAKKIINTVRGFGYRVG